MFNKELKERIAFLEDLLLVEDFFYGYPCGCSPKKKILKSEAKTFQKETYIFILGTFYPITYYTTPEAYKTHQSKIKEWEIINNIK